MDKRMRKNLLIFILFFVGILVYFFLSSYFTENESDQYRTEEVRLGDITQTVSANGTLKFRPGFTVRLYFPNMVITPTSSAPMVKMELNKTNPPKSAIIIVLLFFVNCWKRCVNWSGSNSNSAIINNLFVKIKNSNVDRT